VMHLGTIVVALILAGLMDLMEVVVLIVSEKLCHLKNKINLRNHITLLVRVI
jgi:hypothetical protein